MNAHDIDIDLPEHDCIYETTNESGFIDVEPAYRKSTVLRLIEADRKRRQLDAEEVCAEAYQVVGSLLSDLGIFETHHAEKILDNLSQAKMVHDDVLPWPSFDRKRRGEPVDKGPWKAGVNRSDKRTFIESDDFTHDVRLYVDGDFADQDEKLAYALGVADQLNAAPQPAEPDEERLAMEAVMESVDPATWPGLTLAQRCALGRFAKPQPAEPDLVKCAECGAEMIHVRPGKWQHPDCPQSPRVAEPVKVNAIFETRDSVVIGTTDAKVERVEWQDDGSLTVVIDYWPQPAGPVSVPKHLIERLRKHCENKDNTAFARSTMREALQYLTAESDRGEPVKVPSDAEIIALALSSGIRKSEEHWGDRYYTEVGSSLIGFARALLARYTTTKEQP